MIENIDLEVERLILKCFEKEFGECFALALAVAAALFGNDVLAVALAANQVPLPELVVAAWPLYGSRVVSLVRVCIVVGLLGILLVLRNINFTFWEQIEKHLAVLEERARDIIKAMGYALQPAAANQASGFFDVDHLLDLALGFQWSIERQDIDELLDSSEMLFWYRQSSAALLPWDIHNILFGYAEVMSLDPLADSAYMISVALDLAGHLRLFMAVLLVDGTGTATPGNALSTWSLLWEHLEFQRDACDDIAPQILSRYCLNEIRVWAATTAETSWHIEALAFYGRLVLVAVIESAVASSSAAFVGPDSWLRELSCAFVAVDKRSCCDRGDMVMTLLLFLMLVVAISWAWCNIQVGRGDCHGAMYLAVGFLILRLFIWLLQVWYVFVIDGVFYIAVVLIEVLASAIIVWLYYIALELYVRQHWPYMLIIWSCVLRL